jgi:ABC-type sugar transport system substrate-binding protein
MTAAVNSMKGIEYMGRRGIKSTALLAGFAALAISACGSSDKSSSSSSTGSSATSSPQPASKQRYSSVLDKQLAASKNVLPAITVDLGGGQKVSFKKGEPLKVAFIADGKGFDYSKPIYKAAGVEAKKLGIKLDAFDPAFDPQKEVSQIQDIMNSGKYNAVVAYPLAADLDCSLMTKQLPAKNILPIAFGVPACTNTNTPDGLFTTVVDVGSSSSAFADWAQEIVKQLNGSQKAIVLQGPKLDYTAQQAAKALKQVLPGHVDVSQWVETDYTTPDSLKKMQDALQTHPDTTVIISEFPEGTQGALTALRVAGKNVPVYDFGANAQGLEKIKQGKVEGSSPYYPYTMTKAALEALVLARRGETVPKYIPYAGHTKESIRTPGSAVMFVTPKNVDEFQRLLAEY